MKSSCEDAGAQRWFLFLLSLFYFFLDRFFLYLSFYSFFWGIFEFLSVFRCYSAEIWRRSMGGDDVGIGRAGGEEGGGRNGGEEEGRGAGRGSKGRKEGGEGGREGEGEGLASSSPGVLDARREDHSWVRAPVPRVLSQNFVRQFLESVLNFVSRFGAGF